MRLTVLGCGPAAPQPDTPASGLLVGSGSTTILLDCGQGVAARLIRHVEPDRLSAVIVGHMHADHFIDLSALRYRFPGAVGRTPASPVLLPPGGLARFAALAGVVSERAGFFDDAFEVREYDPLTSERIGELEIAYIAGRHYVPAWGVSMTGPGGRRIVYSGDTGPNPGSSTPRVTRTSSSARPRSVRRPTTTRWSAATSPSTRRSSTAGPLALGSS